VRRATLLALVALTVTACGGTSNPADSAGADSNLKVVSLTARQWSYDPPTITLNVGEPVVLEITSADVHHGFNLPAFGVRADAVPGTKSRVKVVPDKAGTFSFHCDYYCGSGHEGMEGQVVVQ
jgi:cytochrome c oxidase subunit 2